jgi:heme A synthase
MGLILFGATICDTNSPFGFRLHWRLCLRTLTLRCASEELGSFIKTMRSWAVLVI